MDFLYLYIVGAATMSFLGLKPQTSNWIRNTWYTLRNNRIKLLVSMRCILPLDVTVCMSCGGERDFE